MKKAGILVSVLILLWTSSGCWAGHYELSKGRQYEVCRVYTNYLNSFNPPRAMICDRPYNPNFNAISKPKWRAINVAENLSLIEQTVDAEMHFFHTQGEELLKEKRKEYAQEGLLYLYIADIDIDNDSREELVLRLEGAPGVPNLGVCDPQRDYYYEGGTTRNLYILWDKRTIDKKASASLNINFDVFFYGGRTFLDRWSSFPMKHRYKPGKGGGGISVYEFRRIRPEETSMTGSCVCEIDYEE